MSTETLDRDVAHILGLATDLDKKRMDANIPFNCLGCVVVTPENEGDHFVEGFAESAVRVAERGEDHSRLVREAESFHRTSENIIEACTGNLCTRGIVEIPVNWGDIDGEPEKFVSETCGLSAEVKIMPGTDEYDELSIVFERLFTNQKLLRGEARDQNYRMMDLLESLVKREAEQPEEVIRGRLFARGRHLKREQERYQ
jgi:hypothetical protein